MSEMTTLAKPLEEARWHKLGLAGLKAAENLSVALCIAIGLFIVGFFIWASFPEAFAFEATGDGSLTLVNPLSPFLVIGFSVYAGWMLAFIISGAFSSVIEFLAYKMGLYEKLREGSSESVRYKYRNAKLLTKTLHTQLPPLYSQDQSDDEMIYFKFFTPVINHTWYITRGQERGGDFVFRGYVFKNSTNGLCLERFSSPLNSMQRASGPIECDPLFEPALWSEVKKREGITETLQDYPAVRAREQARAMALEQSRSIINSAKVLIAQTHSAQAELNVSDSHTISQSPTKDNYEDKAE